MKIDVIIETGADKRFEAVIDPDKEYGLSFGLLGEGHSVQECINDFYGSVNEMKEYYVKTGKEFPADLEFSFKYDTASFLAHYSDMLSLAGLEKITGINQRQLSHYLNGVKKPRQETIQKIETGIHRFANELSQVNFV
ncbi:MAG: helix-turn-helix transcriptional regulator [Proteiniphilum sp.]|nr:helix-turn-helix transcriptional regulator [Proteiniphilum sp.]MDD4800287.1 helix-turn-helix transcriptional regulator [Proteiniphilum sp.]